MSYNRRRRQQDRTERFLDFREELDRLHNQISSEQLLKHLKKEVEFIENPRSKRAAKRSLAVLELYYKGGVSKVEIARELKLSYNRVVQIVKHGMTFARQKSKRFRKKREGGFND